jgi:hypothetical protein
MSRRSTSKKKRRIGTKIAWRNQLRHVRAETASDQPRHATVIERVRRELVARPADATTSSILLAHGC